uniref:SRS55C n=1 Tax=Toxoplasma gondii (strain ATCC 50861 / VEG) TaxID=432359 RepID=A0A0F7V414_TOXGV|nr:TPA: SRS55C [Toxoplasma gondii VEG]
MNVDLLLSSRNTVALKNLKRFLIPCCRNVCCSLRLSCSGILFCFPLIHTSRCCEFGYDSSSDIPDYVAFVSTALLTEECGDKDVSVTLDANRSEVAFRRANTSLLQTNFEKTFKEHTCSGDEVDLADLPLCASLVEGKSAASAVAATSSLLAGDVPAYTFHVTENPTTEKQLCYKCTVGTVDPARGPQPSKGCKVLITVSPP